MYEQMKNKDMKKMVNAYFFFYFQGFYFSAG